MIKNITLTDETTIIDFNEQGGDPYFYLSNKYTWIKNTGGSDIGVAVTGSETVTVSGGECFRVNTPPDNKIALTGAGSALIVTGNESVSPFKSAPKGGDENIGIAVDEILPLGKYPATDNDLVLDVGVDLDSYKCFQVLCTTRDLDDDLPGIPIVEPSDSAIILYRKYRKSRTVVRVKGTIIIYLKAPDLESNQIKIAKNSANYYIGIYGIR